MRRSARLAAAVVAVCVVAGCDQKKPAPSPAPSAPATAPAAPVVVAQPAPVAAPDPNRPPTDDEVLSALLGFWRDRGPSPHFGPGDPSFTLATPISAEQADNAVTTDVMGQRIRRVSVAYTFRANADLNYSCAGSMGRVVFVNPAPSAPQDTYPNTASAGETFSCTMTIQADKVEEGWNVRPVEGDPLAYLFKR